LKTLVWSETYHDIDAAIAREKLIKKWRGKSRSSRSSIQIGVI
jgi:predicted GIY-YIG superfamily endonuclease